MRNDLLFNDVKKASMTACFFSFPRNFFSTCGLFAVTVHRFVSTIIYTIVLSVILRVMKKKPQIANIFVEIVIIAFILVFTHTAYNKIVFHKSLTESLSKYPIVGFFPVFFTWAIPVVEIITVILLVFPRTRSIGLKASVMLMAAFTLYIIYLFSLDGNMPCTCGGMIERLSWKAHLLVNLGLLALGILSIKIQNRLKKYSFTTNRTTSPATS